MRGPIADQPSRASVEASRLAYQGRVWDVVSDDVVLADGQRVTRDYIAHPGAVAVLALNEREQVLLMLQYRHPVRRSLWEPPAGLLDVPGEDAWAAAARELAEEADLEAAEWSVLQDLFLSPGGSAEAIRLFVARGLTEVPPERRFEREGEERGMPHHWVSIDEAVEAVQRGRLGSPTTVVGVLALAAARASGWTTLRPHDSPWEARR